MTTHYPPPVDKLLTLGDPRRRTEWLDYQEKIGLSREHIPDLIHMLTDDELNNADSESAEVWAPLHAWRTLGQLRAEAAVEPLLTLLHRIDEDGDDWVGEEMPEVIGLIGAAAIPALTTYLSNSTNGLWARVAAAESLKEIGMRHPEARDECVAVLTHQLEKFKEQEPDLNAFLVSPLLDLRAVEAASLIECAFMAEAVEEGIFGDLEDAQIKLGLKSQRTKPRKPRVLTPAEAELQRLVDGITRLSAGPIMKAETTGSKRKRHRHKKKAS